MGPPNGMTVLVFSSMKLHPPRGAGASELQSTGAQYSPLEIKGEEKKTDTVCRTLSYECHFSIAGQPRMSKHKEDEYKTIATPKADAIHVEATNLTAGASKGDGSDLKHEFSFFSMYRYADTTDKFLMAVGILCSAANGAAFPVMATPSMHLLPR
ncbi:unnamed protein product [Aphanomyces euteiches]